jgi:hypothetical protein
MFRPTLVIIRCLKIVGGKCCASVLWFQYAICSPIYALVLGISPCCVVCLDYGNLHNSFWEANSSSVRKEISHIYGTQIFCFFHKHLSLTCILNQINSVHIFITNLSQIDFNIFHSCMIISLCNCFCFTFSDYRFMCICGLIRRPPIAIRTIQIL